MAELYSARTACLSKVAARSGRRGLGDKEVNKVSRRLRSYYVKNVTLSSLTCSASVGRRNEPDKALEYTNCTPLRNESVSRVRVQRLASSSATATEIGRLYQPPPPSELGQRHATNSNQLRSALRRRRGEYGSFPDCLD